MVGTSLAHPPPMPLRLAWRIPVPPRLWQEPGRVPPRLTAELLAQGHRDWRLCGLRRPAGQGPPHRH